MHNRSVIDMDIYKNIIGYDYVKQELNRIIDCINNREKYEKLGIYIPKNLLLWGDPGVGKTLFATVFIKALDRKKYTIKKNLPKGNFLTHLETKIKEAINNQPAVVLLDDMDKYANNDLQHRNAEEFILLQSLIDSCKNKDVYFVATANDLSAIPDSLTRKGRFDCKIEVQTPSTKDATKIIEHYLKGKKVDKDIDCEELAKLMNGESCAFLETLINDAGLYAGYDNCELIKRIHIIKAFLRNVYSVNEDDEGEISDDSLEYLAYHESGHTLISELLEPHSVNLVTAKRFRGSLGGLTSAAKDDDFWYDFNNMKKEITVLLGGKAATEIHFNKLDPGAGSDISKAESILTHVYNAYYGNNFYTFEDSSADGFKQMGEAWVCHQLQNYYAKAKDILFNNKDKLDKLAKALIDKKLLLHDDINEILWS